MLCERLLFYGQSDKAGMNQEFFANQKSSLIIKHNIRIMGLASGSGFFVSSCVCSQDRELAGGGILENVRLGVF